MSQPNREAVYQALFATINSVCGPAGSAPVFVTSSRRIAPLESFPEASAPAFFQVQKGEALSSTKGMPSLRKFTAELVLYVNFGGADDTIPSSAINSFVSAIESALASNAATAFQQLGVPVSSCQINGQIEYFEGVLGVWCVAVMPVEIVANY